MVELSTTFKKCIIEAYKMDPAVNEFKEDKYLQKDGLWYIKTSDQLQSLYVPNDELLRCKIISTGHDAAIAAHPGTRRTYLSLYQWYY
jgi:hypothetical protein